MLPYLNTPQGGRHGGGRVADKSEGDTGLIRQIHLQEPQAAVNHSSAFGLTIVDQGPRLLNSLCSDYPPKTGFGQILSFCVA